MNKKSDCQDCGGPIKKNKTKRECGWCGNEWDTSKPMKTVKKPVIKNKLVIFVSSGNVQEVHTNATDIEVDLIDFDNLKAEGKTDDECYEILSKACDNLTSVAF